jgi:hypothetical protein
MKYFATFAAAAAFAATAVEAHTAQICVCPPHSFPLFSFLFSPRLGLLS